MLAREEGATPVAEPPATAGGIMSARMGAWLRKHWFFFATFVGISTGLAFGLVLQQIHLSAAQKLWIAMPGVLYIRVLQLTIVPVLATSIFNVVADMNLSKEKRLGVAAAAFILSANIISSILGFVSVLPIKTKSDSPATYNGTIQEEYGHQIPYIFQDLLLNAFPADLMKLSIAHVGTDFEHPEKNAYNETVYRKINIDGVNMLGILFCSVAFGLAANAVNEEAQPLKQFSLALYEVVLILMRKFILATPVGVFFMVMSAVADVRDMEGTFERLALFLATHLAAQFVHFLLINFSFVLVRENPFHLLKHCLSSWLIAVATGSRMVGMPHFYQTCDDYGLPESVSRFVLPLSLMLKADGSAIFMTSASLFIAQLENVQLDGIKFFILIVLTTAHAIALPSMPSASVFGLINVLNAIGVPVEQAALLFSLEWLNDRIRCGETVLSSIYCTAFVSHVREKGWQSGFWKDAIDSEPNADPPGRRT
ncbi:Neutral amino acid transporter A [Echinococcus granulosus]|uniref:Amino acid transporter n=1 Tax=Echinococcus granulosus TaxID=6210 RepID=A0A068WBY7_ECHGR|nr:Neutral amino acid transporter A [Echinococcus granulosus]CDS15112.1 neutral amino acid transporter [Echinococcus granulosus]